MTAQEPLMMIRQKTEEDEPLIYATWLRGLYYGNPWFGEIAKKVYFPTYHRVIEALLSRQGVHVRIACLKEDPDVVLGYSVYEGTRLHWVFVKQAWRKLGIAKKLIPNNITTVSHLTFLGKQLKPKDWDFNPFLT